MCQDFLCRGSVLIERALALSDSHWLYDLTVDYSAVTSAAWAPTGPAPLAISALVSMCRVCAVSECVCLCVSVDLSSLCHCEFRC